jgi:regulator of protease activity HflC (stomatin/prohibitin superfamily)
LFIVAAIFIIIAVALFVVSGRTFLISETAATRSSNGAAAGSVHPYMHRLIRGIGVVSLLLGLGLGFASATFTQSAGEADVLVDWTGNIVGSTTTTGLHFRAPWDDVTTFNIRNQQVVYVGNSQDEPDNTGGKANGPDVTVQDKDGVTDEIDIALRYSINPNSVIAIYKSFKNEDGFKTTFIEQDVRSAVRTAPNQFTTLQLLTKRSAVEAAIQQQIEKHWAGSGVSIDSVSMQEVRPPANVVASYAAAQQAQINVTTQKNNLAAAEVSAQQQVVQAQAQAKANDLLTASLSPQILQNKYLDALKAGTVYVVPAGSTPFIQTK